MAYAVTPFPSSSLWQFSPATTNGSIGLKLEPTLPLQTQKQIRQEHLYFTRRCEQYGLNVSSIKNIRFYDGSFSVRHNLMGYYVSLPINQPRFKVRVKDVLARKGGNRHRYNISKAYNLILLTELKRQKSEIYAPLKQAFRHSHKTKKRSIARYLNATNLLQRGAKVSYFRITGRLSSWYVKHIDPMILGFSDHAALTSWQTDFTGLMAQVTEYGLDEIGKTYAGQIRKVNSVIAENNHQVSMQPIRSLLSGKRLAVIKENRKLLARRDALTETLTQLQLIGTLLKFRARH